MAKKSFMDRLKNMGPAALVTSAFIGPGTITTATLAGVNFEYKLLWAALFSGLALMILMEMSGRMAIIAQKDVREATIASFNHNPVMAKIITVLILITLVMTGFGFEAGNLIGGSLGLADLFGLPQWLAALILGGAAFYAVVIGTAKTLEKLMSIFVGTMGLIFILTMILVGPHWGEVLKGLFIPSVPDGSIVNVISLIGTTLIGINLLMHAVNAKEKWNRPEHLGDANFDTIFNVSIGILTTMAIVVASGTILYGTGTEVDSPLVFSQMLEPVLGDYARYIGDAGIAAAGLSSAIATPLILKEVTAYIFGWNASDIKARMMGGAAVIFGTIFAAFGTSPVTIIVFASGMSGVFLPIVALMIMISANNAEIMGEHKNNLLQNILGGIATLVTLGLGINSLIEFFSNF